MPEGGARPPAWPMRPVLPRWTLLLWLWPLAGCHLLFTFSASPTPDVNAADVSLFEAGVTGEGLTPDADVTAPTGDLAPLPLPDARVDHGPPTPDSGTPPQLDATAVFPADTSLPIDSGAPSCFDNDAVWNSSIQCQVQYTCCLRCVDSTGQYDIHCTGIGCACALNSIPKATCQTTDCNVAINQCCAKIPSP